MSTFAERLCEALTTRRISAAELSRKINVDEGTISNYKKGKYVPKQPRLDKISKALNVSIPWLMGADVPMELRSPKSKGVKIPVLGRVVAGIPIDAVEEILDYEEISEEMARNGEHFALQIKGDSMEPKFSEGDVVIIRKQPTVEDNEIAIVLVNGNDATIKKIKRFDGGITLIPTNPNYDVITYTNKQIEELPVTVLGKVVELRAKF